MSIQLVPVTSASLAPRFKVKDLVTVAPLRAVGIADEILVVVDGRQVVGDVVGMTADGIEIEHCATGSRTILPRNLAMSVVVGRASHKEAA